LRAWQPELHRKLLSPFSLKTGLDGLATARIFHRLMTERLNHTKYMAQGGDWGALIVSNLGRFYPNEEVAIHLNMVFAHAFQRFHKY
jgi:hypothetical protein